MSYANADSASTADRLKQIGQRRIAVLFHEKESPRSVRRYVVDALAQIWREQGHQVVYLFGTRVWEPADIILVHIDLSVIPQNYLVFARRYPIALNAWVSDIRRTNYSKLIISNDCKYHEPVILKTNLNYSGIPEVHLGKWRFLKRMYKRVIRNYSNRVFPNTYSVPFPLRRMPGLILEKFLPEKENGLFVVRNYQFLGNRGTAMKLLGREPVVKGRTSIAMVPIDPNPEIVRLRAQMRFDYGKFDYVMHDGSAILLDANKTTGALSMTLTPELLSMRRFRAEGLYWYFQNQGHWNPAQKG